jgi:hypothetical protein
MGPFARWLSTLRSRPRNRATYAVLAGLLACVASGWHLHLLLYYILPKYAPLVTERGEVFPLAVRVAIFLFGGSGTWLVVAVPLAVGVALWVGLWWKPDKSYGPSIVLTFCFVALLLSQLVFLEALFQIAELLSR